MVSLTSTIVGSDGTSQKLLSFANRPIHRRATASGTIRSRDEFEDDMDEPLSSATKKARTVAFNLVPDVSVIGFPPKPLEVVREEVIQAVIGKPLGDYTAYDKILAVFRGKPDETETPISSLTLNNYLIALTSQVSDLKPTFASLVDAIVNFNWIGYDNAFTNLYTRFLCHLASAQGQYVGKILRRLVNQLSGYSAFDIQVSLYPPVGRAESYGRVHIAISELLRVIPSASVQLMAILAGSFPHSTEDTVCHTDYVRNLLEVLSYASELRAEVLELITDRLVKIDVQVQMDLEDVEAFTGEELINELAELGPAQDEENEFSDDEDDSEKSRRQELKQNVTTTDAILALLFEYYEPLIASPQTSEPTFSLLLHQFHNIILPTFRSRHTQFLLFRFAQSSVALTDFFLGECLGIAIDGSRALVLQESAAAYAASFVARAKGVEAKTIQGTIDVLCKWLRDYVVQHSSASTAPDSRRHGAFYSVFQAVLYIFCFRWRCLLDGEHNQDDDVDITQDLEWIPELKESLTLAVHSRLQPLRVCAPVVVTQFEMVSRQLRFMYVASVIAGHSTHSWGSEVQQLEGYFPFDPYKLPGSRQFVEGLYVEWTDVCDEEDDDEYDDSDLE